MKRSEVKHHHFRNKRYNCLELLQKLEDYLAEKKLLSTGFDGTALPNQQWLLTAILHIRPDDPLKVLQSPSQDKISYNLKVNEQ